MSPRWLMLAPCDNAVLREGLARYASSGSAQAADTFLTIARSEAGSSEPGPRWSRDEPHLERLDQE